MALTRRHSAVGRTNARRPEMNPERRRVRDAAILDLPICLRRGPASGILKVLLTILSLPLCTARAAPSGAALTLYLARLVA